MSALTNTTTWQLRAACRGPHAKVFFPPTTFEPKSDKVERERLAKAICQQCDVTEQCRQHALQNHERHGIWGGLNEAERQQILETSPY